MPSFVLYDVFPKDLGNGVHNFGSHTLKAAFTNTAPDQAAHETLSQITEISAGGGYSSGGVTLDSVVWEETAAGSGIWRLVVADETFTASGTVANFRYVVVYNDTPTSPADPLIGYADVGSVVSLTTGQQFVIDVGTDGLFQITVPNG